MGRVSSIPLSRMSVHVTHEIDATGRQELIVRGGILTSNARWKPKPQDRHIVQLEVLGGSFPIAGIMSPVDEMPLLLRDVMHKVGEKVATLNDPLAITALPSSTAELLSQTEPWKNLLDHVGLRMVEVHR